MEVVREFEHREQNKVLVLAGHAVLLVKDSYKQCIGGTWEGGLFPREEIRPRDVK